MVNGTDKKTYSHLLINEPGKQHSPQNISFCPRRFVIRVRGIFECIALSVISGKTVGNPSGIGLGEKEKHGVISVMTLVIHEDNQDSVHTVIGSGGPVVTPIRTGLTGGVSPEEREAL